MKKIAGTVTAWLLPLAAFAQAYTPSRGIAGLFDFAAGVLNRLVPLFIAAAVVWFIWNVFQYTIAGDEDGKAKAKSGIIYGIVGIFIMVSVWGLVAILQTTFGTAGVQGTIGQQLPQI